MDSPITFHRFRRFVSDFGKHSWSVAYVRADFDATTNTYAKLVDRDIFREVGFETDGRIRSCFKIIRIGFSMRYVPYKVPICGGNQNSQTRITPGFGDVAAPVQTGSDALHVVT